MNRQYRLYLQLFNLRNIEYFTGTKEDKKHVGSIR